MVVKVNRGYDWTIRSCESHKSNEAGGCDTDRIVVIIMATDDR